MAMGNVIGVGVATFHVISVAFGIILGTAVLSAITMAGVVLLVG
jgi:hypothetical protein